MICSKKTQNEQSKRQKDRLLKYREQTQWLPEGRSVQGRVKGDKKISICAYLLRNVSYWWHKSFRLLAVSVLFNQVLK